MPDQMSPHLAAICYVFEDVINISLIKSISYHLLMF